MAVSVFAFSAVLLSACDTAPEPGPTISPSRESSATATEFTVTGDAPSDRLAGVRSQVQVAMRQVVSVWGAVWSADRPVSVQVPATGEGFARLTGASADTSASALTTPGGVVVLHPRLWTQTSAAGRQVVITHELTHVALGQGSQRGVPAWVIEGSAELTAYRPTGLPVPRVAPDVADQVRRGAIPAGPLADADLRPTTATSLQVGYQQAYAWSAFLVGRAGLATFTSFVRSADAGTAQAFERAYGVQPAALSAAYQDWWRGLL